MNYLQRKKNAHILKTRETWIGNLRRDYTNRLQGFRINNASYVKTDVSNAILYIIRIPKNAKRLNITLSETGALNNSAAHCMGFLSSENPAINSYSFGAIGAAYWTEKTIDLSEIDLSQYPYYGITDTQKKGTVQFRFE